jgi:hypothetical protein
LSAFLQGHGIKPIQVGTSENTRLSPALPKTRRSRKPSSCAGQFGPLAASPNISYDFASTTATGGGVMHKLEAIKILETELAAIEREHHAELAGNEDMRDQADAKAEAKALAAVFDFLKDCKISHRDSLLRILERYLRRKSSGGRRRDAPVMQGAKSILAGIVRAQKDAGLKNDKAAKWTGRYPNSQARPGPRTGPKAHRIRPK